MEESNISQNENSDSEKTQNTAPVNESKPKNIDWIKVRALKKYKDIPWEIRIDMNGKVFVDGEPYDNKNPKYKNLSIDVERHSRLTAGEETQKIREKSREAKRGEVVTIKDTKGPDRVESTTVKF